MTVAAVCKATNVVINARIKWTDRQAQSQKMALIRAAIIQLGFIETQLKDKLDISERETG